jgi:hypothetical protein
MPRHTKPNVATVGDVGKRSFDFVDLDRRGTNLVRHNWTPGKIEAWLANRPPQLSNKVEMLAG